MKAMEKSSAAPPPGPEPTATRPARTLGRPLLLALASLALALAVAEAVVRTLGVGPVVAVVHANNFVLSDNPVLRYELRPGSEDGDTSINEAGFRDREFPQQKPDGVFRIAAIGDSVTFGFDVAQHEAYPKELERLLNASVRPGAPRYEVLNFGVSGYNIPQVVERLRTLVLRYQPDLVLYGYTLNDPQVFSFEATLLEQTREAGQRALDPVRSGRLGRVLAHSRLYRLIRVVLLDSGRIQGNPDLPHDPGMVANAMGRRDRYFRGLHRNPASRARLEAGFATLGIVARDQGASVLVAVFPLFVDAPDYPLADIHDLVSDRARAAGLEVVDLQLAFAEAQSRAGVPLHGDLMHPTALGHRVAAHALLLAIAARQPGALDPGGAAAPGPATAPAHGPGR